MANTAKSNQKTKQKSTKKIPHLYKERNPDNHKITGKFTILFVLFAITTLIFAIMSVYLFFFASQILDKYENIDAACRNGNCQVIIKQNDTEKE